MCAHILYLHHEFIYICIALVHVASLIAAIKALLHGNGPAADLLLFPDGHFAANTSMAEWVKMPNAINLLKH